jgi:hypothetical protein
MPIHDWTRVDAGLFHAFHQGWIVHLCDALNTGGLQPEYFALPEQSIRGPISDILTLRLSADNDDSYGPLPGVAVANAPPRMRHVRRLEEKTYTRKANRVAIRHQHGQIVAIIEIVSPGNKASNAELRAFVQKTSDLIAQDVHLLVIDLFAPSRRDPQGVHGLIWNDLGEEDFMLPTEKPLVLAAYEAGPDWVAYVEPVAVGDVLPDMPLFLRPGFYIHAPLEATYQTTWNAFPALMKRLLEQPATNTPEKQ